MSEKPSQERPEDSKERLKLDNESAAESEFEGAADEGEQPSRKLSGFPKLLLATLGVGVSLYAFFWVLNPLPALFYRSTFLAVTLAMAFVFYRAWGRPREEGSDNPGVSDWILAVLSVVSLGYIVVTFDEFVRRGTSPTELDLLFGVVTILLILEATRRTAGWVMPAFCVVFLAYGYLGALIPDSLRVGHVGYGLDRIIGQSYMGLEGIFGVPIAVAATYLVLFTIFGAFLQQSGAAKFFLDVSFSAFGGSKSGPGRTTTLSGYLLGSVSGSGTATAVTLASVLWPVLRRAGYNRENGAAVLAASGIGAIIAPPTMGAAAFIIAEFLGVSYLQVIVYAVIPAFLYYLGILLAIEADARRMNIEAVDIETEPLGKMLLRYGYYFLPVVAIVVLLVMGLSPFRAVFYATLLTFLLSFLSRDTRMGPRKIWDALSSGAIMVLPVIAVCAAAGIIVAVITLTGLGIKLSSLIVALAGGTLFLTALYAAFAILLIGLAVPVTASFIISSVIIAPAFTELGVPQFVAYMFVFYYAVLSEVSPPTALAAVATSAITGGNAITTMWKTWKYTLPAFLVPFAFVLSPNGEGLLLQGGAGTVLFALIAASLSVAALSVATGAWLRSKARLPERLILGASGLMMLYLEPLWVGIGTAGIIVGVAVHLLLYRMLGDKAEDVATSETDSAPEEPLQSRS